MENILRRNSKFTSIDFSVATHNYGGAAEDWTLTTVEANANFVAGKTYNILNTSGQVLTFKRTTGGTIANTKLAIYLAGASDVFEIYEQHKDKKWI